MELQKRKLKYHVASTLDGFIARSDGRWDCFPTTGAHIEEYVASLPRYGTVLMGRKTYEVGLNMGVTDPYPFLESYVFSRSMKGSPDARVTLVAEGAIEVVQGLKAQPGNDILLCGGGELAQTFFAAGLIDEVVIKLNPLLLGNGTPLAPGLLSQVDLTLLSSKVYQSDVLLLEYAVNH
jgi:dihydrofolate reductase